MKAQLNVGWEDVTVIVAYLIGIVALGCWVGWRQKLSSAHEHFVAGRSLRWYTIGLALFSTSISTFTLVSLAQEGYRSGLVYGNLETLAPITLLMLGLFFAPFYIRSGVTTLPDFLEKRYSRANRRALVVLTIFAAIFIHLAFALFTGGKIIEALFGIDLTTGIIVTMALAGIYSIVGGLKAIVLTEAVQAIILVISCLILTATAFIKVGGWPGLTSALATEPERLTLLRASNVEPNMTWYAVLLGYPISGVWYWCTDQTIVQRVLGAKNEQHAQVGPIFAGFLKLLGLFLFVFPGLLCYALVQQGQLESISDSAHTLPYLITKLLPSGVQGFVLAALLAALMCTTASALNSIATVFCYDIYRELRPASTELQMLSVGRLAIFIAILVAIIWTPSIGSFGSMLEGNTAMICYIAPSITTVFLWGVFWRGASKNGALTTLICGGFLGIIVFLLDWYKEYTGWTISFMMSSVYLFIICSVILFVVSALSPQEATLESKKLVWENVGEIFNLPGWRGLANYKCLSFLLIVSVAIVYLIFK